MLPRRVLRVEYGRAEGSDIHSRLRKLNQLLGEEDAGTRNLSLRWGNLLLALAFLAIVYCTLFPFNFTVPAGQTLRQAAATFDWRVYDPSDPRDTFDNIILFLPFGFALACWLNKRAWPAWAPPALAFVASALFSSSIETLQLWLPTRDSSLADICSNTTGGVLGALIYFGVGRASVSALDAAAVALRQVLTFWKAAALFLLAWALTLYSPLHLYHDGRNLTNWQPYPLAMGNLPSGDRPWQGTVQLLELSSYPLSGDEAMSVARGTPMRNFAPTAPGIAYTPTLAADAPDLAGSAPVLSWVGPARPDPNKPWEPALSRSHWLQTPTAPANLIEAIRTHSKFSLHLIFSAADATQGELARIIAIAPNPYIGDLAIAQNGNDLAVRVRTQLSGPNGTNPTWMVHNLIDAQHLKHDIVLTYTDPMLRIFVDGQPSGSAVATPPEFFSLGRLMARLPMLPFGGFGLEMYRVLFYTAWFTPLGILLGIMAADLRTRRWLRITVGALGVVLPPLLLMVIFGFIGGRKLRPDQFVVGPGVLLIVLGLTRSWVRRHLGRYDTAKTPSNVIDVPGR